MHTHHVMSTGFFAEIVEEHLCQPTQLFQMLRQLLADLHDLFRQFTHRKTMFGFLSRGQIEIENSVERGNQRVNFFTVIAQPFRNCQRRRGFGAELFHTGGDQLTEQIELQTEPRGGDLRAHLQRIARHVR
ncbi:hypothetical protein D3C86_1382870 [compost metagenome]